MKSQFSHLPRLVVHLSGLLPLLLLISDALTANLSANPIQEAEQRSGETALIMLLLCLACTPLNILFGFSRAVKHRRALGLYAFFYASLHLFIFAALDYGLEVPLLLEAIQENHYILVGLSAFLCLLILAVTSFRWWMRRLGKNWTRLHRIVYLAGGLVIVHYAWIVKGDVLGLSGNVIKPLIYGAVLAVLLGARIPPVRRSIIQFRHQSRHIPTQASITGRRDISPSEGQK